MVRPAEAAPLGVKTAAAFAILADYLSPVAAAARHADVLGGEEAILERATVLVLPVQLASEAVALLVAGELVADAATVMWEVMGMREHRVARHREVQTLGRL